MSKINLIFCLVKMPHKTLMMIACACTFACAATQLANPASRVNLSAPVYVHIMNKNQQRVKN